MKKIGIIFLLISGISLVCLFVLRLLLGGWVDYLFVPMALFVGFGIAGLWTSRQLFREFFSVKTTREGMSMGAMVLMVLALLVAINYLGAVKYKTFDFSSAQVNTLSEQSRKLLAGLGEDLKVLYFYQRGAEGVEDNRRAFIELIQKYQDQSSKVKLQFVEVNENPKMAEDYGVNKGSGLVFLEYKGRRNKIEKIDEQELTAALVKVTREKDKKIFFTMGHRERDWEEAKEPMGMNLLKKLLEGNRYTVAPLNLNQTAEVPADADLVMITGPEQSFMDHEIKALENYLKRGGSLILALDPKTESGLNKWIEKFGIKIGDQVVAQVLNTAIGKAVNPQVTPVTVFSATESITQPFGRGEVVVMRLPSPIVQGKIPSGLTYEELTSTDANSMAFQDSRFEGEGKQGPFAVGAILKGVLPGASETSKPMNLVVFSDSDFLSNQLLYKNLNRDLALNTVAYLAKEENVISITPKEVEVTKMEITETQFYLFVFGFVIPLPLLMVVASGYLWYRRRFA